MTARGTDAATLAKMDEYEQAKQIFGKIKSMVEAAAAPWPTWSRSSSM